MGVLEVWGTKHSEVHGTIVNRQGHRQQVQLSSSTTERYDTHESVSAKPISYLRLHFTDN